MKKFFNYLKHNTHFFLLLYALIYIPWFTYLEKKVNINSNFHVIHVALDDYIPFCEFFVIPYYLWFIYMAIGILFIAFTDGKLCWRMGIFLITGMTVFLFISAIYPNGQLLRPESFARDNIFVSHCAETVCDGYTDESVSKHSCIQFSWNLFCTLSQ